MGGPGGHGSRDEECRGTALPPIPARRTVSGLQRLPGCAWNETRPGTTHNDPWRDRIVDVTPDGGRQMRAPGRAQGPFPHEGLDRRGPCANRCHLLGILQMTSGGVLCWDPVRILCSSPQMGSGRARPSRRGTQILLSFQGLFPVTCWSPGLLLLFTHPGKQPPTATRTPTAAGPSSGRDRRRARG